MKTGRKTMSFVAALAMALLMVLAFGVCSGFTVRGESNAAEYNPFADVDSFTVEVPVSALAAATDPGSGFTPSQHYERSARYTITDAGQMKNPYDIVPIYANTGYTKEELHAFGFCDMTIQLRLTYWQKDHGYQWFYIYGDSTANSKFASYKWDNGVYTTEPTRITVAFTDLDMAKFANDTFYIRYDGSGDGADTWYNQNLLVVITYYKA